MANDYYDHNGYPAPNAPGSSAALRIELDTIEAGFDKLPQLTGNGDKLVRIKADGTGIEAFTAFTDTTVGNASTTAHGLLQKLPGNTSTFLRADGTFAPTSAAALVTQDRTSNTKIVNGDTGKLIRYTAGGFTQTFDTAVLIGNGAFFYLQNASTGDIELASAATVSTTSTTSNAISGGTTWTLPTGLAIAAGDAIILRRTADAFNQRITGYVTSYNSGTGVLVVNVISRGGSGTFTDWTITSCPAANAIDGLPSYVMYPGEVRLFTVDPTQSQLRSVVLQSFYRKATTSYSFICPPGYRIIGWDGVGGAGGAGSGAKGSTGSPRSGGSPGGAPGRTRRRLAVGSSGGLIAGYSYAQTVGAAGTSGAVQTVNDTAGLAGTAGGNTTIGTLATAYGGVAGLGGSTQNTNTNGAVPGSGSMGAGAASSLDSGGVRRIGGAPVFIAQSAGADISIPAEEGGAGAFGAGAQNAIWGGGSAAVNITSATNVNTSGSSVMGVAAGGWGGSVTIGDVANPAINAAASGTWGFNNGAVAGTSGAAPTAGANGAAVVVDFDMGNPGAGGGCTATANVNGGRGGNGTGPGAPGGGGGACTNGTGSSGAGGTSQPGQSITWGEV